MLKNPIRATVVAAVTACALTAATFAPAAAQSPGSLIAVEPKPAGWHGLARGSVVEYWMTDSAGVARPASGAVYIPDGEAPATGWPILAYDHGTSGSGPGCGGQADPELAALPQHRAAEAQLAQDTHRQGREAAGVCRAEQCAQGEEQRGDGVPEFGMRARV